ncbi:MAG: HEAT repeat domain-containing protein, partial [Myxococcota bacterium]
KSFGDREALARIVGRIQAMARGDFRPPKQEPYQDDGKPVFAEMTGRRLVSYVKRHGLSSVPETELEYLTYRTDGYLTAPSWQMRNLGVKLVGLLQLKERLGLVIYLLRDKRLAPRWQRRLGGDYMQVGFLRRNALHTLTVLGVWNEEVRSVFLEGLSDRYFEVRTSALKGLVSFLQHVRTDQELCAAVVRAVDDSDFEVRREAILAMGVLVDDPAQYERLRAFEMDPNWRIREAVLIALCAWVERGVIQPERLRADLEQFLLTSTGFVPHFQIRERMLELSQAIEQKASSKSSVQRKDGGSGSDVVCSK